ncbi:hypothetical protein HPB48_010277 [Haemaphysalis longicornis]|uniref:RNA-dependent RNA polymerase n=1 Tax=Haemaphysalis longicornis TaxID=44386 RepID=A0A9J6FK28_HAELO|nr:hypothetical protein HPB48_010277 [Haemaphysalis longicornis]
MPCQVPRGSCLVRRLFVTPSRIFYLPPTIHSENRVLRKFDADHVLRVSFRDDHFEVLSHTLGVHPQKEQMMDVVVGRFLKHGLKIGDRHFRLLASSASQLRDHGDPQGNTVESIRAWMGDFSTMPDVAKKIARMGQCFSTTEESVTVPLYGGTMEEAADIVGGTHPQSRKPYVFSDGIGMISEPLMKKVCAKLDLEQVPSAIQIRYAGYKGMLCTNNALEGDKLVLRKSMNKFACSTSDSLEVIKVSAPSPLFLNRPLITILEQLGVPGRVFLSLQQSMVLQLCDAFESNEAALNVLCTYTNASLPFLKLHLRGMALSREPFTRSLLLAVYKHMIGECSGTVLVTKCPCLHPGDVRKFVAVDVPALRHIRDCIVFPARGPRPHPNEMAGMPLSSLLSAIVACCPKIGVCRTR